MYKVIISGLDLSKEDIICLNKESANRQIEFSKIEALSLIDAGVVMVMVQAIQNIGYSALYDMLKYCLSIVVNKATNIRKKETTIELTCNGQTESLTINFELTDSQKDKLIDAVVKKFTR
ncbi:hypothetical protein [Clostridium sp. AN503]|uniref:hypothetical protein n=1 Tax=Clostridium sp. AN503 TaxID=3160598 RepID=UPI003458C7A6